jgi:nucleoid-associated protein YgaU
LKYTYFTSKGVPLRAEVSMSFRQFMDEGVTPPQNPTSGTPNPGQVRRLEAGQYLDTVADELYGDPGQWRAIAHANGIDDPLALDPGRVLMIPELEG